MGPGEESGGGRGAQAPGMGGGAGGKFGFNNVHARGAVQAKYATASLDS